MNASRSSRQGGGGSSVIDRETAPAKINLALHVIGRRDDGYHLLDTLVVHGIAADIVTATPSTGPEGPIATLAIDGPFAGSLGATPDNLVLRAAELLAAEARRLGQTPFPVSLRLTKHLPIASGIGGGSSDAAATLRLLNRVWGLGLATEQLAAIALPLGADLPMCVHGRPLRARGIGEAIEPIGAMPSPAMVLVNPGVAVSTPAVFRALTHRDNPPLPALPPRFADTEVLFAWLAATRNDLEAPAIAVAPVIAEVLSALSADPGCRLARMSGSGATCFAIFADEPTAEAAADRLAARGWWTAAGRI
jgi:4-diphosphocytidyl-2-C-methyl-D-erythritol kinase